MLLLQAYVLSPVGNSVATNGFLVSIFNFLLAPQVAQLVGISAGAFVAYRTKDVRAISVAGQLVVLAVVLAILGWLGGNAAYGIESRGLSATDFTFLRNTASFDISEHLIPYDRTYTYGRAFLVGALNTLFVSVLGIFFATIVGLFVGIARLSSNWLMSTLARAFVELMRNVPLLVLLFFIYAGVLLQLPQRENTIRVLGNRILLNNRGVAVPWFKPTETFSAWVPYLVVGLILAGIIWYFRNRTYPTTGRPAFSWWFVPLGFVVVAGVGVFITHPLLYQEPFIKGFNYAKDENQKYIGMVMTPEFFGVLSGLVLYTGAYIGEVVRAGIQAVSKGQREAATALGLSQSQSLQLIILPQALQVIIPPLTNQYLNLAKNSSLAIAVGYADLFAVANTTFNQSGQSVQVILMLMATYLSLSLTISVIMNFINSRVKIKER
ncbi:MAG TPA: ABC transporter permease subunit [Anaerolineae bacterium]|nr:ABC transporter permease subunit [Anaerolineae bacterium]